MSWTWDKAIARYRDQETGRFLSSERVLEYVQESIGNGYPAMDQLAGYVANGTINADTWELALRDEIRQEYIRQYLLGVGGEGQMTKADWGSIGGMLKEQYHPYLDDFRKAIESGNLSEAQIAARARMYMNSAREAFERGKAKAAKRAGQDEVSWNVDASVENCPDCLDFQALGWQKVADNPYDGAYPGSGATACIVQCHCNLDYRKAEQKGEA
jgi:hypothetical protein